MKRLTILLVLFFSICAQGALTKSVAAVDEWAETAMNAVREGATTDVSGCYAATLHISMALSSETAHTGSKVEIQLSSATTGDEDWATFTSFIGPTGTPNTEALGGTETAGATVLEVASTTGFYDDDETRWVLIEDNTIADSEMVLLVSHVSNTSVTIQDGTTHTHDTSDVLWDIAKNWTVDLPMTANRVRVIYDNTYDVDGATIITSCRITKVTGL